MLKARAVAAFAASLLFALPVLAQSDDPSAEAAPEPGGLVIEAPESPPSVPAGTSYGIPDLNTGTTFEDLRTSARRDLADAAAKGDSSAAYSLAQMLLATAAENPAAVAEGLKYLKQAADAGVTEAQRTLGDVYAAGRFGEAVDIDKAMDAYKLAADAGDVIATVAMADLILNSRIDEQSRQHALAMLQAAANSGSDRASTYLGTLYANGGAVPADFAKSLSYYERGIVTGNLDAVVGAGDLFRQGTPGVEPEPAKALALYEGAAVKGNISARRRIADMIVKGEGVPQDFATGRKILDILVAEGDTTSLVQLGDYFADGQYVVVNADRALEAYTKAAELGDAAGYLRLATLYTSGLQKILPSQRLAMRNFDRAISLGSNSARRVLADELMSGDTLGPDPRRAMDLYAEAAAAGDSRSALRLGQIYSQDQPYQADYAAARKYFQLATSLGALNAVVEMARAFATVPLSARTPGRSAGYPGAGSRGPSTRSGLHHGRSEAVWRLSKAGNQRGYSHADRVFTGR